MGNSQYRSRSQNAVINADRAKEISDVVHQQNVEKEYRHIMSQISRRVNQGYKTATICGKHLDDMHYYDNYRLSAETKTRLFELGFKIMVCEKGTEKVWWD